MRGAIAEARACLAAGDKKGYQARKQGLPMFIFMCTFTPNKGAKGEWGENTWRLQRAAVLNGLVMLDYDHLDEQPAKERAVDVFNRIPSHMFDDDCDNQILYAARTCSGDYGLRLVCKADPKRGNLADNQAYISRILNLHCDESIKNADRTSFVNYFDDIFYINKKEIFTYSNEEYDKMYGGNYRQGNSRPTPNPSRREGRSNTPNIERTVRPDLQSGRSEYKDLKSENAEDSRIKNADIRSSGITNPAEQGGLPAEQGNQSPLPSGGDGGGLFRGVPYTKICEEWLKARGGAPAAGSRHMRALQLASDLRYICDNKPANVQAVLLLVPFVKEIVSERGEQEIADIAADVCDRKMNLGIPRAMQAVLKAAGVKAEKSAAPSAAPSEAELAKYAEFWNRLKPLMTEPFELATYKMHDYNKLGGVFAAAGMFCTLMTRCWYRHFNGEEQRMNPQVYLIGNPASGKGEAEKLNEIIMAPVRVADEVGRHAEEEYKKKQAERETSSKASKGDALQRPEFPIRILPSRTSNAVFFRRALNATEQRNGVDYPLHLYTFDSELDGNTEAQKGGSWISKHDLELKAFHNEWAGVDFANKDSVNALIPIYYNYVVSGTPLSLGNKITLKNVNDGLCSRMAIFKMLSSDFAMVARGKTTILHEKNCKLKEWAFKFDKLEGELPIERLVDHVYDLCEQSAWQAEAEHDLILDYLRKRAVFYATWFTVPRIMGNAIKAAEKKKDIANVMKYVTVSDEDLEFSTLMYDAVIYWQDYFFGLSLQTAWDNAANGMKQRVRNTNNTTGYLSLPQEFDTPALEQMLQISNAAARSQITRWINAGYIERIKRGMFKKIAQAI